MANIGDLVAYLKANTRNFDANINRSTMKAKEFSRAAGKHFSSIGKNIQSLARPLMSLQTQLLGLAGVAGLGFVAKGALDVAASFESMEIKLDTLTKGRGKETLQELNAWALEMPVNTRKAVDTFAMMKAMGLDPNIESMQTLVDVASVMGEEAMPRMARALGQMATLGKISAEELNQMAEVGINARKYLMDSFGMTVEELQKSGKDINVIVKAIMDGMAKEFEGAAVANMKTWRGLWTTTVSYIEEAERMIMAAGVFDALKEALSDINDGIQEWIKSNRTLIEQKVPEYVESVKDSLVSFYERFQQLVNLYNAIPEEIVGAAGTGIVVRYLFGSWTPAKIAAAIKIINDGMKNFGLDVGSSVKNYDELRTALKNLWEVFTLQRDPNTGLFYATLKRTTEEFDNMHDGVITVTSDVEDFGYAANEASGKVKKLYDWTKHWADHWKSQKGKTEMSQALSLPAVDPHEEFRLRQTQPQPTAGMAEMLAEQAEGMKGFHRSVAATNQGIIDAYDSMYSDLKWKSDDYYAYAVNQIQMQGQEYYRITGDIVLANQWMNDRLKELNEERASHMAQQSGFMIDLSQRTSDAIEDTFSALVDDTLAGKFHNLRDVFEGIAMSMREAVSNIIGQSIKDFLGTQIKRLFAMEAEAATVKQLAVDTAAQAGATQTLTTAQGAQIGIVNSLAAAYYNLAAAKAAAGMLSFSAGGAGGGGLDASGNAVGGWTWSPRQEGGALRPFGSYIVGEGGKPELIQMGRQSGHIYPVKTTDKHTPKSLKESTDLNMKLDRLVETLNEGREQQIINVFDPKVIEKLYTTATFKNAILNIMSEERMMFRGSY